MGKYRNTLKLLQVSAQRHTIPLHEISAVWWLWMGSSLPSQTDTRPTFFTGFSFWTLFPSISRFHFFLWTCAGKSGGDKLKLKLKGGGVVDPDSGLEDQAHVLKSRDALYSVVLGVVDIQHDRNSYYKLQILEHDKKSR